MTRLEAIKKRREYLIPEDRDYSGYFEVPWDNVKPMLHDLSLLLETLQSIRQLAEQWVVVGCYEDRCCGEEVLALFVYLDKPEIDPSMRHIICPKCGKEFVDSTGLTASSHLTRYMVCPNCKHTQYESVKDHE